MSKLSRSMAVRRTNEEGTLLPLPFHQSMYNFQPHAEGSRHAHCQQPRMFSSFKLCNLHIITQFASSLRICASYQAAYSILASDISSCHMQSPIQALSALGKIWPNWWMLPIALFIIILSSTFAYLVNRDCRDIRRRKKRDEAIALQPVASRHVHWDPDQRLRLD